MQLTVFWRMILTQFVLIALVLTMSLAVFFQFQKYRESSTELLATNTTCLSEEKRLLDLFLFQQRSGEQYLLLRDNAFLARFFYESQEFTNSLETIEALIKTPEEHALIGEIRTLHARYSDGLAANERRLEVWKQEYAEIGDRLISGISKLVRLGELRVEMEAQEAKNRSGTPAPLLGWILIGMVLLESAVLYLVTRGVSRPLTQLAREMRMVAQGDLHRSLRVRGPRDVAETIRVFNHMVKQLAERDSLHADFLAQMSHELRTPLAAIQEGSALLLEEIPGALNVSQREIVQVIRSNNERLFGRLTSILELSKMEAHKVEYTLAATDLIALVKRSVEAIGPISQKKQLRMTLQTPSPLPAMYLDEDRIRQVLDNLLSNAVKFTPDGGEVRVATALRHDEISKKHWVEVRVSDSGVGVRPEETEQIFQKFYQSSTNRRQASRGSGLGLAIARHIVEAHGGKIWVESRPGEGATFIFTLPVRPGRESDVKREARTEQGGGQNVS
jgi:two-component system, NtrC family, sensor histidine kinase GlrK